MEVKVPNAKLMRPDPIPVATYEASMTSAVPATAQGTGNPMLKVVFTLHSEGPNPEIKTIGRTVKDNLTITPESLWRINMLFLACTGKDLPEANYSLEDFQNLVTGNCMNKQILVDTASEVYQGRPQSKITAFKAKVV